MRHRVVGIDIGGTNIKGALVDSEGKILAFETVNTEVIFGYEFVLKQIRRLIDKLVGESEEIAAVGVGVPGMLNFERDKVLFAPNLNWISVDIKYALERLLEVPVYLDNDANAAALGESWLGEAVNVNCFMLVTLGTGIGSGIILNKEIYRGCNGLAAELGHMTVVPDGPFCSCGNRGCLEVFTGAQGIVNTAKKNGLDFQTADEIFAEAERGNRDALDVIKKVMDYMSIALANAVKLLDVQLILIGGGLSHFSDVFLSYLKDKTYEKMPVKRKLEISIAGLGNKAGFLGAARLAIIHEELC